MKLRVKLVNLSQIRESCGLKERTAVLVCETGESFAIRLIGEKAVIFDKSENDEWEADVHFSAQFSARTGRWYTEFWLI